MRYELLVVFIGDLVSFQFGKRIYFLPGLSYIYFLEPCVHVLFSIFYVRLTVNFSVATFQRYTI